MACATKTATLPPAGAPKFPDFIFPAAPAGLGTPAAVERHDLGWRWLQFGDPRAAERNFNAALKQSQGFYPAEAGLGYAALARKDPKEAAFHFDRAVVANPRTPRLSLAAGKRSSGWASAIRRSRASRQPSGRPATRNASEPSRGAALPWPAGRFAEARKLADSGKLREARTAYEAAIAGSPQSPFLYRELATVERRDGEMDAALAHARKAVELDPNDSRSLVLIGEIYESQKDYGQGCGGLRGGRHPRTERRADSREDRGSPRTRGIRGHAGRVQDIESAPTVTRGELAALLGVRLDEFLRSRTKNAVVMTDTRGHWAAPWILSMVRAGLLEVYPNHTFQPDAGVRRGDLAQAASRALGLVAAENPRLGAAWRDTKRTFPDINPNHLGYPAASRRRRSRHHEDARRRTAFSSRVR